MFTFSVEFLHSLCEILNAFLPLITFVFLTQNAFEYILKAVNFPSFRGDGRPTSWDC